MLIRPPAARWRKCSASLPASAPWAGSGAGATKPPSCAATSATTAPSCSPIPCWAGTPPANQLPPSPGRPASGQSHRIRHHLTTANRPSPAVEATGMRYRLVVRVTAADIGKRVTIRWRPPELDGTKLMTDVLGMLEDADDQFFKVRRGRDGQLIVIPRARAVAGKVVPPAPPPRRPPKAPGSS